MPNIILKGLFSLTLGAFLAAGSPAASHAQTPLSFEKSSRLSEGNWVKVSVPNTGVCRISYDELTEMGFSDPSKVAVFGRGGERLDNNFRDSKGNALYSDELKAVSTMHKGDALYFFAQGAQHIRYSPEGVWRVKNNVYTNDAYYFLTDSDKDAKFMSEANAVVDTSGEKAYDRAFGYQLIEEENLYPSNTGEEFFGWEFTDATGKKVEFPYSLPGSREGDPVQFAYYGVAKIIGPSPFTVSLKSEERTDSIGTVNFSVINKDNTYSYTSNGLNVPIFGKGNLPSASGEIIVAPNFPERLTYGAMDYIVLTAPRDLAFQEEESSYIVYTPDYTAEQGPIAIGAAPEDLVVWDVVNSNDAVLLPTATDDSGIVYAAGLREGVDQGKLVAFSPSGELLSITGYKKIENQNIHALASGEVPVMLIITTSNLKEAAKNLAEVHRQYQNEHVVVATGEELVNEFSQGNPDPIAYRAAARMFYDADNGDTRTFRNVMLFGPLRLDNRGTLSQLPDYELLICKESEQGDSGFTSYTILDYYGQMADYYGPSLSDDYYFLRSMDVAVGVVPADTPAIAQLYVNKVKKYLEDTDVASWMGNLIYTADGTDAKEHQDESNRASKAWKEISDAFVHHKIFNNAYPDADVRKNFINVLNKGSLWAGYLGHASSLALNSILWNKGDYKRLTNDNLGFMHFGGCTITDFDRGGRGSGEEMVLLTDKGLVGAVIPNRTTLSVSNYNLMLDFINASLKEKPFANKGTSEEENTLLASPRTFGEISRLAFNHNSRGNTNKLAYVLMCDPALVSLMPSADVRIKSDSEEIESLTPGTSIGIEGTVTSRDGKTLNDFSGKVIVNLYAPSVIINTRQNYDSDPMEVEHDIFLIGSYDYDVKEGMFSGSLVVPDNIGAPGDELTIRMTAFDPSTRRTAAGSLKAVGNPFDEEESVNDTEAPVVDGFYVNSPSFSSGDTVTENPIVYAVITDNLGMSINSFSAATNLSLVFDGNSNVDNLWQYCSLGNEGKTLTIRVPRKGLSKGMHSAQVKASDLSGNVTSATIYFNVQENNLPEGTSVEVASSLVRDDNAEFTFTTSSEAGYSLKSSELVVTDSLGNIVSTMEATGDTAEWNAKDSEGIRVAPGVYYAYCRFVTDAGIAGVSEPVRLIVMRPSDTN